MTNEAARPDAPLGSPADDLGEYALQALAMSCAAGGMAHQVKNPLNAMALQIALVAEKLGASPELSTACAGHLAKLRDQIGRVDDAVRGYLEVADPSGGGAADAGRMVTVAAALFGHEARRRHVGLEAVPGAALWARCDPARAQRLWSGLVWRALAETPEGGAVRLSAWLDGAEVVLAVERTAAGGAPAPAWVSGAAAAAAAALGGRLVESTSAGTARVALCLPGGAR
jgi:hypothetical protein